MPKEKYESPNPRRCHTIMSQDEQLAGKKSSWTELEICGPVRNLGPELWKLRHLTSLYLNDNNLSHLPADICKLNHLTYLDLSSNKLRSLPSELGELVSLRELLLNHNYLRSLPYELGNLFQLQNLGLKGNPLAPEIMNIYAEANGTHKLLTYMLDHLHVARNELKGTIAAQNNFSNYHNSINASQPPQRQWISTRQPDRTRSAAIFTVMCYNVLCDKYCTRQQYGYCPSWALNWEYRKKGIMEEIRNYNADIISLQEVETDQFYNLFLPELKADGYDGIFSPKSRARTMSEQERKHVDGCAIFFRMNKFSLIKEHLIEFNQIAMANAEGSDDMLNRVMTKDNIGLAAILETKEAIYENGPPPPDKGSQKILVATAHIHWDPEFSDVKLIQTMMLMWELRQFIEEFSGQKMRPGESPNMPVLLCGDLNSLPDSGVVEYLTSGKVAANHGDFKEMCYEACLKKINHANEKEFFNHNFKLARAYNDVMPYTNYTYDFKGIIDYIFYSRDYVKILGMLGPHDEEWFRQNKVIGCPHPHMPSDHFSLFIELEMLYQSSNSTRPSLTSSTAANTQASTATTVTTSKPR
ncbi:CCR4-NOT transcription complex subunit 6-like isoform X2 [Gigantopelta aegis]|uniref:CCR4-NOT transcription complex subunit 6-like isoform X2 n=1 Tax=Gigantopelta aegis TaxID=1735272 RepID=UPI001B88B114|nr:CCR4-NOT transcription complex subunit 6-like isoform X2 [Gigantopelta aegis]